MHQLFSTENISLEAGRQGQSSLFLDMQKYTSNGSCSQSEEEMVSGGRKAQRQHTIIYERGDGRSLPGDASTRQRSPSLVLHPQGAATWSVPGDGGGRFRAETRRSHVKSDAASPIHRRLREWRAVTGELDCTAFSESPSSPFPGDLTFAPPFAEENLGSVLRTSE